MTTTKNLIGDGKAVFLNPTGLTDSMSFSDYAPDDIQEIYQDAKNEEDWELVSEIEGEFQEYLGEWENLVVRSVKQKMEVLGYLVEIGSDEDWNRLVHGCFYSFDEEGQETMNVVFAQASEGGVDFPAWPTLR